jgi:16S rRNA (guanine527-N7)-methyltransferase
LDNSFSILSRDTLGLFPKGQDVAAELTQAAKYWKVDYTLAPSRTDSLARIVVVRGLERRKAQESLPE